MILNAYLLITLISFCIYRAILSDTSVSTGRNVDDKAVMVPQKLETQVYEYNYSLKVFDSLINTREAKRGLDSSMRATIYTGDQITTVSPTNMNLKRTFPEGNFGTAIARGASKTGIVPKRIPLTIAIKSSSPWYRKTKGNWTLEKEDTAVVEIRNNSGGIGLKSTILTFKSTDSYRQTSADEPDYIEEFFESWEARLVVGVACGCVCCFLFSWILTQTRLRYIICCTSPITKIDLESQNTRAEELIANSVVYDGDQIVRRFSGTSITSEELRNCELVDNVFNSESQEKRSSGDSLTKITAIPEANRQRIQATPKRRVSLESQRNCRALSAIRETLDEVSQDLENSISKNSEMNWHMGRLHSVG